MVILIGMITAERIQSLYNHTLFIYDAPTTTDQQFIRFYLSFTGKLLTVFIPGLYNFVKATV